MISIDLTKIKRFKHLSINTIKKFLHPIEIEEFNCLKKENKPVFLATRWAIKECIYKIDNSLFDFKKLLIKKTNEGKYIFLDFQLSTTIEDGYVAAVAFKKID
ncbi:Holo-[acyl-carrier-protein] synthase [Metamycoplasma auris 15026]|uniref:Holo-[acyl-carrier-protein] synthase n=1 Tax=Metamycoplasma auris 15026 TaxID=1188233 RepID=N9VD45_9BACT|nr:4'-phosphopantetheinyl transferase superfamily protein [Metamycoplasma auris]ENY69331.1 Holo-[acyl-carrier-protein] synthase [Metamycoplasma auris 15026]